MSSIVTHPIAALIGLLLIAALIGMMLLVYRDNRMLFRCLMAAVAVHAVFIGFAFIRSLLAARQPAEVRVKIAFAIPAPTPPPKATPKPPHPAPKIIPIPTSQPIAPPKGREDATTKNKVMPKGHTLDKKVKPGPPPKTSNKHSTPAKTSKPTGHFLTNGGKTGDIASNPDGPDSGLLGNGSLGTGDVPNVNKGVGSGEGSNDDGTGGDAGTPEGHGNGDVPKGFKNGKVNGRMYWVRLRYGDSAAWRAHEDGTRALLAYLKSYIKVEDASRAMTADELEHKFMRKGEPPTFLYIYCDEKFVLKSSELSALNKYIEGGGFLFLDSRNDTSIQAIVQQQIGRIVPGSHLTPIPKNESINSALYKLPQPGFGENWEGPNYGVKKDGRYVIFYTRGNFSDFYSSTSDKLNLGVVQATFQMGANIMVYAMNKGDVSGISKRQGASYSISSKTLIDLGFLDAPAKGSKTPGRKPGAGVKIKPKPGQKGPEDIHVLD